MPIVVVNMIPNNRSGESNQDSEPNITVDPSNPSRIAGSAFTPNLAANPNAPIYVSTNGGSTWALASIVPSSSSLTGTGDISVRFAASGTLYAGILRRPSASLRLNILRSPNFTSGTAMTVLVDRTPPAGSPDQPWVEARTGLRGAGAGRDHVYVGSNDRPGPAGAPVGRTGTIDRSLDGVGATTPPPSNFTINRVETRATTWFPPFAAQDAPPVRPAAHPDGTVYAVLCAPRSTSGSSTLVCDIVVVRDDNWGSGATPFAALTDASDSLAGRLVMTGRNVPWFTYMGQQRLGPNLAIAVDPRNSSTVYIAWADLTSGSSSTIHVRRSTDRGVTWSATDLKTVTNATNVGLALNTRGKVGLLYQRLTGTGSSQRWVTQLELTTNDWATAATSFVLATVPASTPAALYDPYIGDYANLVSLGKDFYGIFSANNTPNNANFPNGVTYQRNANFCDADPARHRREDGRAGFDRPVLREVHRGRDGLRLLRPRLDGQSVERRQRRRALDPPRLLPHERRLEPEEELGRRVQRERPAAEPVPADGTGQRGPQLRLLPHPPERGGSAATSPRTSSSRRSAPAAS